MLAPLAVSTALLPVQMVALLADTVGVVFTLMVLVMELEQVPIAPVTV